MVKLLSKLTKREKVIEFCRREKIECTNKNGVIMISKESIQWWDLFDNWDDAELFLINARLDKMDNGIKYPWEK